MRRYLLKLDGVSKKFGYKTILKNISFEVAPGEFVLLLGKNGVGKSTLLKIICSLMLPSQGTLWLHGQPYKNCLQTLLREIGYISHESRLYGDLTAQENLQLFGTLYHVEALDQKIEQTLAQVELDSVRLAVVRNFSSGMLKRLAIARFLLYQPELLILDEPYTGLDQVFVAKFQQYLADYQRSGKTVIMVTHQFDYGQELATRCLVLHHKHILHDVSAKELTFDRYQKWIEDPCN